MPILYDSSKNLMHVKGFSVKTSPVEPTKKFYELSSQKYHNVPYACEEIFLKQTNLQKKKN